MSACVFVGPTLALADARALLDATFLPPVKQGDVYRIVSLLRPKIVAIIDGYFQWVPSVWHKEILWAIHEGVHVFGAASMGALRAAELAPFGMHGVGRIFEGYRDGVLEHCGGTAFEDDDEVAVAHGPGEVGYVALSEAMVNIRCTLLAAEESGAIRATTHARLVAIAKSIFFPERTYDALFDRARGAGLPEAELGALREWLPGGRIDQKRADAAALLAAIRDFAASDPAPARAVFSFEHTTLWERSLADHAPQTMHGSEEACVLEELRLDGGRWEELQQEAVRSLMQSDADVLAAELSQRLLDSHGRPDHVARLIEEAARGEALRRSGAEIAPALIERQILARIRATDGYSSLLARAGDKRSHLAERADLPQADEFSELQLLRLRDWYFTQVLGQEMPEDIEQWTRAHGYRDRDEFHRAIFAEHVYRRIRGTEGVATAARAQAIGMKSEPPT